jgi:hypothetical protein
MQKMLLVFGFCLLCLNLFGEKLNFKEKYICYWDEQTTFELSLKFKGNLLKSAKMTTNRNFQINVKLFNDKDTLKGFMTFRNHDKEYIFTGWLVDSNFLMCEAREVKTGKVFTMYPFLAGTEAESSTEAYKEFISGKVPKFDEKLIGKWVSLGYHLISDLKGLNDLLPIEKEIKLEFKDNGGTKSENFWLTRDAVHPKNGLIYRIGENRIYYRLNTMEDQVILYSILYYAIQDNYLLVTRGNKIYYFIKQED